ncbi:molybdopterin-dependent oxidoreductase [Halobacterium sp. KA-6]|jgi:DMSO/TMAO reductase YedYZ molybdopterin-dependent catalytic subunit|uniref:molybdopterin-dependent oxidoreductase n=1 Tax=Halobacterium sp. KA-6 TaxID=2896368 RepID=UPI001E6244CE|nr:molybdopterin-dependent oxidoreductase [Halobacterium sp. KA-6]MCD2203530.1 molybdopterin-dependent oxidoreductase [Halobacterium sp. KA-6]
MSDLEVHDVPDGVDPVEWRLDVTGDVARSLSLDRGALADFPKQSFTADFTCVEGWVAEDLSWRGVRVGDVLDRAAPTERATHALVHAMDGEYACSFPLDRLTDAVLALELDGSSLPVEHGGPARLVPTGDADCWESVKWVSELELTDGAREDADTAESIALSRIA